MDENHGVINVFANPGSHRFEVDVAGHKAFLQYYLAENSIVFTHTEVPQEIEGQGVGGSLVRAGLDYARHENLTVVPLCQRQRSGDRLRPRRTSWRCRERASCASCSAEVRS